MQKLKVNNMTTSRGNAAPNQFIIIAPEGRYFQSYELIIAFIPWGDGKTVLDERKWQYNQTTCRYRKMFLNEGIEETQKRIDNGVYLLGDLN